MECQSEGECEGPGDEYLPEAADARCLPVPEAASEESKEPATHDRQYWPGEETPENSFQSIYVDEQENQVDATGTNQDASTTEKQDHEDAMGTNKDATTAEEQNHGDAKGTNKDATAADEQNHGDAKGANKDATAADKQNHGDAKGANKDATAADEQNHGDAKGTNKHDSNKEGVTSAASTSPGGETSHESSDSPSSKTTSPETQRTKGTEIPSSPSESKLDFDLSTPTKPSQASPSEEITEPQPLKKNPNPPNDPSRAQPPPGMVLENLTIGAAAQRLRRIFQPRKDGSFLVPQDFVDMYKDVQGGGRKKIEVLFERMSYSVDRSCKNGLGTYCKIVNN